MEKAIVLSPFCFMILLMLSSCSKEQTNEIMVDSGHVLSHSIDLMVNDDSNIVPELIHVAGDIGLTIADVIDEDTEPNLK